MPVRRTARAAATLALIALLAGPLSAAPAFAADALGADAASGDADPTGGDSVGDATTDADADDVDETPAPTPSASDATEGDADSSEAGDSRATDDVDTPVDASDTGEDPAATDSTDDAGSAAEDSAASDRSPTSSARTAATTAEDDTALDVSDVLFDWGVNDESNGGAYFGGCNFLSAGIAGNTGSARLWTQADGFYRTEDGNTTIVKPAATGSDLTQPTWATKCQTPDGRSVNGVVNATAANSHTDARVQIEGGTGTLDPDAGTASVSWTGSFTVAYYGGMTYWSASDPVLTVAADGTGTVKARLSGFAADMDDMSVWQPLAARTVVLANFSGVEVTADGLTATPDYLGVSIPSDVAGRDAQAAKTSANSAWWGAFPADFLRFQELTGQSSYWFTTDGGATSIQPRKVALPLTVTVGTQPEPEPEPQVLDVSDVLFDWGVNDESNGGAYFGGCNFLSAGIAGNTGSARLWTQADGFYRTEDGNTTIVKPAATGSDLTQPTWATKCQTPDGRSVNGRADSTADSHTQTRVQISGGTGTIDLDAGTASISWTGSFTVAYYGGMTYWSVSDPVLTVAADGTAAVTGTFSGYGTDMDDTSIWSPITARTATLATLTDVEVSAEGLSGLPDYLGVAIPGEIAGRNPQAARSSENAAWWGAFPASFLSFQVLTGQNSYWYTTDGGAGSIQPRKVPLPLTITVGASTPAQVAPRITSQPRSVSADEGRTASFTVVANGRPLSYQWQRQLDGAGWTSVAGATTAALTVDATTRVDRARYRVVVSNDLGREVSRAATLTVRTTGGTDPGEGEGDDPDETGPQETSGALFDWGINNESSGGAYFGGCNFLSAGVAGDAGSARVWTQSDGFYRSSAGNTTIVRPDGDDLAQPTWATRCDTPDGTSVNGKTTSAGDSYTQSRVRITGGEGTIDADANTAKISWTGSFTVAYYGGMTYWSASDPVLTVRSDGSGTVTATLSGYASDMDDSSLWGRIAPRTVVLATLTGVEVTESGFTHVPDYLGVTVPSDIAGRNAQPDRTADNRDWWGAFPADFVRFQALTGQSSYWYTTAGGAGTIQPRKVPLALTVCATSTCTIPESEAAGGPDSLTVTQSVLKPPTARLRAAGQAALAPQSASEVVIIQRVAAAPPAVVTAAGLDERIVIAAGALVALLGLLVLVAGAGGVLVLGGAASPAGRSAPRSG